MKILIHSRSFSPAIGGLERFAEILANGSALSTNQTTVLTDIPALSSGKKLPYKVLREKSFLEWYKIYRNEDVIVSMNLSLPAFCLAKLARTRLVVVHHSTYESVGVRQRALQKLRIFCTRFTENIAVSTFVASKLAVPTKVIPNSFDNELFRRIEDIPREKDFVYCGRLVSEKGVDICISAFHEVKSVFANATLTIVGEGPEKKALEKQVETNGLETQVEFQGSLEGDLLVRELNKHRCMIVPSAYNEPFGIVALEGVACCEFIIASKLGGLPEAIGECGRLIEPSTSNFSEAMLDFLEEPIAAKKSYDLAVGKKRAEHLKRHSKQRMVSAYLNYLTNSNDHA